MVHHAVQRVSRISTLVAMELTMQNIQRGAQRITNTGTDRFWLFQSWCARTQSTYIYCNWDSTTPWVTCIVCASASGPSSWAAYVPPG